MHPSTRWNKGNALQLDGLRILERAWDTAVKPVWTWEPNETSERQYNVHNVYADDCASAREKIAGYFYPQAADDLGCTDAGAPAVAFLVFRTDDHDSVVAWAESPAGRGLNILPPTPAGNTGPGI